MFEHPDGAGGEGRVQARLESPRRHYAIPAHLPGELAPLDGGSSRRSTVMRLGPSGQPAHIRVIRRRSRLTRHRPGASGAHPVRTSTPPRPLGHTVGRPAGVVESCRGMPHRFLLDSWSFHISVVRTCPHIRSGRRRIALLVQARARKREAGKVGPGGVHTDEHVRAWSRGVAPSLLPLRLRAGSRAPRSTSARGTDGILRTVDNGVAGHATVSS